MRPIARCTAGSRSCTPRLMRVTPMGASASRRSSGSEVGSSSMAISASGAKANRSLQPVHDGDQAVARQRRRRAAAPVNMGDAARGGRSGPRPRRSRLRTARHSRDARIPAGRPRCCSRSRGRAGRRTARAGRATAAFRPAAPRASARRRSAATAGVKCGAVG